MTLAEAQVHAELAGAAAHRRGRCAASASCKGQVEQAQAQLDQAELNLVLDRGHGAAGRLDHQAQRRDGQLRRPRASRFSRSSRPRSGSPPTSRRPSSTACGRDSASTISVDAYPQLAAERPRRQHPARLRIEIHRLPAGERDRQFRQDRAARAGQDRHRQRARSQPAAAARDFGRADGDGAMNEASAPRRSADWKPRYNPWLIAVVGDARGLHGDPRHHDRQCRAAAHRRQPVGEQRRGDLGADLLSRRQRHRADDLRLAGRPVRPQALFPDLHRACSPSARSCAASPAASRSSSCSGCCRAFSAAACSPTSSRSSSIPSRRQSAARPSA